MSKESLMTDEPAPVIKKVLIKRIKVPVPAPGAPGRIVAAGQPAGVPSAGQKVPVKRVLVKVPVKRPVPPAQQPRPAPAVAVAVETGGEPSSNYNTGRVAAPVNDVKLRPLPYQVPPDILDRIEARKTIPEKFLLLYIYARTLAERNAARKGYDFPPMRIPLPKNNSEIPEMFEKAADDDFYADTLRDFMDFSPFIAGLQRITKSGRPVEDLLDEELARLEDQEEDLTPSQQIVLGFLFVLADMQSVQNKLEMQEVDDERAELAEQIRDRQSEESDIKQAFVAAIERKHFPVDADKLITNYMTFARKSPEEAYRLLTTNPLYFSPIQIEKMPRRFFGLMPPSPADALKVNKQLAHFLKKLEV